MNAAAFMAARSTPLQLVIFDCDGVLADSEWITNQATAEAITAEGWPMTAEESIEHFLGLNFEAMLPVIEARLGRALSPGWVEAFTERLIAILSVQTRPIPGAVETLRALEAAGMPWRVASNSSHGEMNAKFAAMGISELVAGRLHSYKDVREGKPAPDLFLAAAAAGGVAPAECVVIEDSATGARAAKAAGMPCLGFSPQGGHPGLLAQGAVLFDDMAALPSILAGAPR